MTKTLRCRFLTVAFLMAAAVPVLAQQPAPPAGPAPQAFAWWKSEPIKKELGLTTDQSTRIEKIWETARPELRQEWDELSRLDKKLSRLIQNDADEAVLARQIDRVETARANANKTRSLMFVQMRKVLTAEQRSRLDAIHARRQQQELQQPPPQAGPRKRRDD